ncbi:MAG: carboxymuconolactone decarboxylase family protein [Pseudomonadota bacterium]|nr:carboxymuconolactone decarboxylase family protein [Pseudomonadota bacterium]
MPSSDASIALPLSPDVWPSSLDSMRAGFAGQLNVYKVMAHHPALLRAWASLRQHVVIDSSLTKRQSEIVILRAGHRWGAHYEWMHHVVRGRQAGLSDDEIAAVRADPSQWPEGEVETLLKQGVDYLLDDGQLPPGLIDQLRSCIGLTGIFDVMATVGMYSTLAFIVKSFHTPLEPEILSAAGTALL